MNFSELGLKPALARVCQSLGYTEPTPIQMQAIPVVLKGSDLIGCAETGTGKTAAFLLPIIQRLQEQARPGVRVLILAPTRELASQIEASFHSLAPGKGLRVATLIGGTGLGKQTTDLRGRPAVGVAAPGRRLGHVEGGARDGAQIGALGLDEADGMLDRGGWPA